MKTYFRSGQSAIFDSSRRILVPDTPEERVRQQTIATLTGELGYPADLISTEFPISRIDKTSRLRADCVIWQPKHIGETALLVIELKAPHVPLTDTVIAQALEYRSKLQAHYVGIGNGNDLVLYKWAENRLLRLAKLYTFNELLNAEKLRFVPEPKLERLAWHQLASPKYLERLQTTDGVIGLDTPKTLQPLLSELDNFILCEPFSTFLPLQFHGLDVLEDLGYSFVSYGNAAGGSWPGNYRGFMVKDLDGSNQIYRIGILAKGKFRGDPRFGNSTSTTTLIVAIDDFDRSPHNSLQMNLDKSIFIEGGTVTVRHDGRLTAGKTGSVARSTVLQFVRDFAPSLILDNQIVLGCLPVGQSLHWSTAAEFLLHLILYANVRDKLRKSRK